MALIALAESAQDIASGFNKFLDPLPESSVEITALIAECYAISSALRELNSAKDDPRYYHDFPLIYNDVAIVRESLDYTFRDVTRLFGSLGRLTHIPRKAAFHHVWRDIDEFFYHESHAPLLRRLETNKAFLLELTNLLVDGFPWNPPAPEVPTSPTTTTTFSTLSSSASSSWDHWLPRVFGQNRPATPFRKNGVAYIPPLLSGRAIMFIFD
ncbi:MAG: hypothetical protein Q9171_000576 [Xanthocarpia ochracea]